MLGASKIYHGEAKNYENYENYDYYLTDHGKWDSTISSTASAQLRFCSRAGKNLIGLWGAGLGGRWWEGVVRVEKLGNMSR